MAGVTSRISNISGAIDFMATSFLSEHSAEFCLVPSLCAILEKQWLVTPVYFWSTREGSRLAQECDSGEQITILAMFARRPKMSHAGDQTIQVKINFSLQERTQSLLESGIPVLAGVPLVSSILNFQISSPCVWLRLTPSAGAYEDIYIEIDKRTGNITRSKLGEPFCILTPEDIRLLTQQSRSTVLSEAIQNIKGMGRKHNYGISSRFLWFGNYKPVYFLLRKKR